MTEIEHRSGLRRECTIDILRTLGYSLCLPKITINSQVTRLDCDTPASFVLARHVSAPV